VHFEPRIDSIFDLIQLSFVDRAHARVLAVQLPQIVAADELLDQE
jgi:hypothetical protein